jgi:hypothetical protein
MREHRQTWLVVTEREGAVIGLLSLIELPDLLEQWLPEQTDGREPESVRCSWRRERSMSGVERVSQSSARV